MKFKKILCIILSVILISVLILPNIYAQELSVDADYVEGEVIFKYETPMTVASFFSASSYDITDSLEDLGLTNIEECDKFDEEEEILTSGFSNSNSLESGVYKAQISGDVLKTCQKLEDLNGIEYAEPNYIYYTDTYTEPTELSSSGYKSYMKWYFDYMNIPKAWSEYDVSGIKKGTDDRVTVAVIDNGFYTDATDFPANLWDDGNGNHGYNGYAGNYDISPVYSSDGTAALDAVHGSNVAGIIGMAQDSTFGIGVAYNAEIMLLKCAGYNETTKYTLLTSAAIYNCIVYATNNNADIINMSLGGTGLSTAVKDSINTAYSKGIAIFAAAGNNKTSTSKSLFYPAAYSNVIGVMAIDKTDTTQLANFSNYDVTGTNTYYDVAAPGVNIIGCSLTTGNHSRSSGTSQASPLVAGCAALYWSQYPDATVEELYDAIKNSATKYVTTNSTITTDTYNYKVVDAYDLLKYSEVTPEIITHIDTTSVILDENNGYIYGLDEGFEDISNYIEVTDGTGTAELIPTSNGKGTGSVFNVYDLDGEIYKSYSIIIFGDINGDCIADGQDSVLISWIADSPTDFTDSQIYAADVDFDNTVTDSDCTVVSNYAVGSDIVIQIR